jgi:hypothetical protein
MRDIRLMETLVVKVLEHKLDLYSPYHYIEFFIHIGFIFNDGENASKINMYILDAFKKFVKDEKFIEFTSLEIAAACIVSVIDKQANEFLEIYEIKESEYKTCLDYMKG